MSSRLLNDHRKRQGLREGSGAEIRNVSGFSWIPLGNSIGILSEFLGPLKDFSLKNTQKRGEENERISERGNDLNIHGVWNNWEKGVFKGEKERKKINFPTNGCIRCRHYPNLIQKSFQNWSNFQKCSGRAGGSRYRNWRQPLALGQTKRLWWHKR